jgi:hypothetical protein
MPKVFCCYRREDSIHQVGRIFDQLCNHFAKQNVFKDVDSIPLGLDFRRVLTEKVGQCDVLLAIIGDTWLNAADAGGRRLDSASDFVRIEIETALARGIPVVPVLVGRAPVPREDDLPGSLRELAFRNGLPVRPDPDFHNDITRLVRGILEVVDPAPGKRAPAPLPPRAQPVRPVRVPPPPSPVAPAATRRVSPGSGLSTTKCPACARPLSVEDGLLGRPVRCPGCQKWFAVAADSVAPERSSRPPSFLPPRSSASPPPLPKGADGSRIREPEVAQVLPVGEGEHRGDPNGPAEGQAKGQPPPFTNRPALQKVARGLTCIFASVLMTVGLAVFSGLAGAIFVTPPSSAGQGSPAEYLAGAPSDSAYFALTLLLTLLATVSKGVDVYGHYLAMAVPAQPGGSLRRLAAAAFRLTVIGAITSTLGSFAPLLEGGGGGTPANAVAGTGLTLTLGLTGAACYLAGLVAFILFLEALALAMKRDHLDKLLRSFLIVLLPAAAVGLLLALISAASVAGSSGRGVAPGGSGFTLMLLMTCFELLAACGLCVWYMVLLVQVRRAVRGFARQG